jgi:cellulose synthase/poly-beta-1,6-N-acetylglucosamine synthase-like glycosyltransferase
VIIPAHNEAEHIGDTVLRVKQQVSGDTPVFVIADNCTDTTAAAACDVGAIVWERDDPEHLGKGYALNFAWERLAAEGAPDVVVCIDADCSPGPDCIATIARLAYERQRPAQAAYSMHVPAGAGGLSNVSALAVYVKNVVRPRGLQWLRLPCLLTGSGMAFPAAALAAVRHPDGHIVEDLRASTDFAIAGFAPMPCMEVAVSSPLPVKRSGFMSQRTRWEHGHMRTILTEMPKLVIRSILAPSLLALALELAVPPLSLLVSITCASVVALAAFGFVTANWIPLVFLAAGMFLAASGVGLAWLRGGRQILPARMLAAEIPRYIGVKAPLYLKFLSRPQTAWVRTERGRRLASTGDALPAPHATSISAVDSASSSDAAP